MNLTAIANRRRSPLLALTVFLLCGGHAVHAQAPEQVFTPAGGKTFVPKNRAPVARDVLKVRLPKAKTFTLTGATGGGARLFVVEDHKLPLVTITVSFRAGSVQDGDRPGVATLTAALLTAATANRDANAIVSETARMGANLNAEASTERTTVSVSGLSEDTDKLVDLLADVLLHPTFPADRLEKVKFLEISRRRTTSSNPQLLATQLTREVLYGKDTPYGRPAPSADQIHAILPGDLKAFAAAHYRNTPDTLIGVAGDVKAKDIDRRLERALADWPTGPAVTQNAAAVLIAPKDKTAVYVVDRPGSAQTYINFANVAVTRTDPDSFALLMANYILGGSFNSRLNSDLREDKGYTYGVRSGLTAGRIPGIWTMGGAVRNAVTRPAIAAFYDEFARMQAGPVSPAELEAAKRAIIGGFALTLESPSAVLDRIIEVADFNLPADYWDTYPAKLQAVTADDVLRVTRKYLGTGRIQLIAVGEKKEIESGVTNYGPVTYLTPEQVMSGTPLPAASVAPAP